MLNKFSETLIEEYKEIIAKMQREELMNEVELLKWEWRDMRSLDCFQKECLALLEKEIVKKSSGK